MTPNTNPQNPNGKTPEPVINRALIAAVLQLVGLAGVMSQTDLNLLVDILVVVLPPLVTLVGAWLARQKVRPLTND